MTDPTRARVFDKSWKYTKRDESDIRKTFARVRREQKAAEAARPPAKPIKAAASTTVRPLVRKGAK